MLQWPIYTTSVEAALNCNEQQQYAPVVVVVVVVVSIVLAEERN